MKIIKLMVLMLMALSFNAYSANYSHIRSVVVPVIVTMLDDTTNVLGNGSGVIIAPGLMVTAAHVIPDDNKLLFQFVPGGKLIPLKVIKIDRKLDLALVTGDFKCPCATFSSKKLIVDQDVYSAGFPMFSDYGLQIVSPGIVQGAGAYMFGSTNTSAPGSSGGGVFILENGVYKWVGIIVAIAIYGDGQNKQIQPWLTFSVVNITIAEFLKDTPAHKFLKP